MKTAVYPGSLDPITFGHIDAIRDAAVGFDRVVAAIGVNPSKSYMFSLAEREALARKALADISGIIVSSFSGLLVHYLVRNNWNIVVRGIRNGQDLSDAMLQDTIGWQQTLAEDIRVFYVPSRIGRTFVSSTALKGVLKEQGDASAMAPLSTIHATQARMLGQYLYGVTGVSGTGKTSLCKKFRQIAEQRHIALEHLDLDSIAHGILGQDADPLYVQTRQNIQRAFGESVANSDGLIDRKTLGEMVFGDSAKMQILNGLMNNPVFFRMNDMLRGRKGMFLIDAALLAETNKTSVVNNNMLLTTTHPDHLARRLTDRDGLSAEQVQRRLRSQYSTEEKSKKIAAQIEADRYGQLLTISSDDFLADEAVERVFDAMLFQVDIYGELRITGFLKKLGVPAPSEAYTWLRKAYSGNNRFYHALSHVVDGLNQMPDFIKELDQPDAFTLGWLFHDAVYDTRSHDNEEQSAELLKQKTKEWGLPNDLIEQASRFVLVTKHGAIKAKTPDEKRMVDLDMSILGRPMDVYASYESAVRREYGWVPEGDWRKGRGDFLRNVKAPFFHTRHFSDRYEDQARANISRALEKLSIG